MLRAVARPHLHGERVGQSQKWRIFSTNHPTLLADRASVFEKIPKFLFWRLDMFQIFHLTRCLALHDIIFIALREIPFLACTSIVVNSAAAGFGRSGVGFWPRPTVLKWRLVTSHSFNLTRYEPSHDLIFMGNEWVKVQNDAFLVLTTPLFWPVGHRFLRKFQNSFSDV